MSTPFENRRVILFLGLHQQVCTHAFVPLRPISACTTMSVNLRFVCFIRIIPFRVS